MAYAIVLEQMDDFEDGTTQGWIHGVISPNPPVNIPTGGPLGAGDNYLEITSTGVDDVGGRLVAFNISQWLGDYLSAGVTEITMDVNNLGAVPLDLRVAIDGPGGRHSSSSANPLPVGSGWQTVVFSVTPASLTPDGGFDLTATLSGISHLRILSSSVPTFHGDIITATLGVDNIVAGSPPSIVLVP